MIKQNDSIKLGKRGVNYVTTIVDNNNCNFNVIQQENDVGIDGIIEFFDSNHFPTGQMAFIQIKTGKSYYDIEKGTCNIQVGEHKEYWKSLMLPVIGIVCMVNDKNEVAEAYWVDIKKYLQNNPLCTSIRFEMSELNKFNASNFKYGFYQVIFPGFEKFNTSYEEAVELVNNKHFRHYAYYVLAVKHSDKVGSWEIIYNAYKNNDHSLDLCFFYDSLSYVLPHPDHWCNSENYNFSVDTKKYITSIINEFTEEDLIKMLSLIEDDGIERGTIGQSIEILISKVSNFENKLLNILVDSTVNNEVKQYAEIILAYHNLEFYKSKIEEISKLNLEMTEIILEQLSENGELILY